MDSVRNKGRFGVVLLVVLVLVSFSASTVSAGAPEIAIFVEDEWLELDVPPVIRDGRTLVPMRAILEALGATVAWEDAEQKITADKAGLRLEMWVDNDRAFVNGVETVLDVPPTLMGGRTLIPLRFVSEELGEDVIWDPELYSVGINSDPADILPRLPFQEESIAGVRLGMTESQVRDFLGSPVDTDQYYSDFIDTQVKELHYPYGKFLFFLAQDGFRFYEGEITEPEAGGPRNVRVGDTKETVLQKFPDEGRGIEEEAYTDGYYRILYGSRDHLQDGGVVNYDSNMQPYEIGFGTEDYLGFRISLEDGLVSSFRLLMQLN